MLLTIKDLSARLNIKPSTLYLWATQGKIPCRKIHGLIRFDPDAITAWLCAFEPGQPTAVPIVPPTRIATWTSSLKRRNVRSILSATGKL